MNHKLLVDTKTNLLSAAENVLQLTDLSPNPNVNMIMSNFVTAIIEDDGSGDTLFTVEEMARLRAVCSAAESEMEFYWSRRIAKAEHSWLELERFPYRHNYTELVGKELDMVRESGLRCGTHNSALVIGSGPLPLTALELHRQSGMDVDHVDSSRSAAHACELFYDSLSLSSRCYVGAGESVRLDSKYDLILIAALAGSSTAEKRAIVDNALSHLNDDGRIVVRSATGVRRLLYPEVAFKKLKRVRLLSQYHPVDEIINSVLLFAKDSYE